MKDATIVIPIFQLPLGQRWFDRNLARNNNSIYAELLQNPSRSGFVLNEISAHVSVDFAMNEKLKVTRGAGRQDGALSVDKMQSSPHRCAAGPRDLPNGAVSILPP